MCKTQEVEAVTDNNTRKRDQALMSRLDMMLRKVGAHDLGPTPTHLVALANELAKALGDLSAKN